MKRTILIAALCMLVSGAAFSQGVFDYFWIPRPVAVKSLGAALNAEAIAPIWLFKPSLSVSAMYLHKGVTNPVDVGFLNGAGPAICFEHSIVTTDGLNYSDYSVSLALLITGSTDMSPTLSPTVCLTAGFLNNIIQIGPAYTLSGSLPPSNRFGVVLNLAYTPTQNP